MRELAERAPNKLKRRKFVEIAKEYDGLADAADAAV